MIVLTAAWTQHTEHSRLMAQDICTALAICGIPRKAAADRMGITENHFSAQLAGTEPLHHYRLGMIGRDFRLALLHVQAQREGGAFLPAEHVQFVLGAAQLGIKKMLKMLPVEQSQERRRA